MENTQLQVQGDAVVADPNCTQREEVHVIQRQRCCFLSSSLICRSGAQCRCLHIEAATMASRWCIFRPGGRGRDAPR